MGTDGERPAVSVIVPFLGGAEEAWAMLDALGALRLCPGDELIVADNTPDGVVGPLAAGGRASVVAAPAERSAYYARNVAAERASGEWLLFTDADCVGAVTLLDDFFEPQPARRTGAVAGRIAPAAASAGLLVRWAASREVLEQARLMELPGGEAAATANLLVRRSAWRDVGGFLEGVRSGADVELCWRLADAGWEIEYRPGAVVEHVHRETLAAVVRQFARYAAGNAWLRRRRAGSVPRPRLARPLARSVAGMAGFALTGRFERAAMKAVDAPVVLSQAIGYLGGNAAPRVAEVAGARGRRGIVLATDRFPTLTEGFVAGELAALAGAGRPVRVEALERPARPREGAARGVDVHYMEDEGALERARALAWLVARHPLRVAADLAWRRRFDARERMPLRAIAPMARRLARGGERHVHVHFASLAAANALRAGRLAGVSVSITAHAHEIYAEPRGLAAKLAGAAFVTTVCEYNARHLRSVAPPAARECIHTVQLGIDPERFRRTRPYPGGRTVVAVGRLVEKKGFRRLIEAAAELEPQAALDRVVIAGDGPLRAELTELSERLGVGGRVDLPGALDPGEVRELLERADLVCVPSVVAANGDRDALPVVVYEALAMEVPVVASDEVGLPEVVKPQWGKLVPPGDPVALADAIDDLLSLPADRRAKMGAAGRKHVTEHHNVHRQTGRLMELIEGRWEPRSQAWHD